MYALLPEVSNLFFVFVFAFQVLLNLSKISSTVHIAIPVLEFLSTLLTAPQVLALKLLKVLDIVTDETPEIVQVFSSLKPEQFLSVFAITLPYTNPFKFNHYTVRKYKYNCWKIHIPPGEPGPSRHHHVVPEMPPRKQEGFRQVHH